MTDFIVKLDKLATKKYSFVVDLFAGNIYYDAVFFQDGTSHIQAENQVGYNRVKHLLKKLGHSVV